VGLGLAVVAVFVLGFTLVPEWPVRQHLVLHLEAPENIRSIAATWTREDEQVPRGGTRSAFATGAPPRLDRELSLPNGDYVLRVSVERRLGGELLETSREHRIRLEGREVTVFVAASAHDRTPSPP
jgi:hypothetical protein